jgi:hypothetical protein
VNNPPIGSIEVSPAALVVGATSPTVVTVTGGTFIPASVVNINGKARATTYANSNTLTFVASIADESTIGALSVTVTNPAPGGGTSPSASLAISAPSTTPVILSVTPNSLVAGSADTSISLAGTGFTANSVVQWNGTNLVTEFAPYYSYQLVATVPAAEIAKAGTASVTVNTPTATPALSNAVPVTITNPPAPTLTSIYPNAGPINTAATVTLNGTGFTTGTTVSLSGTEIICSFTNSTQLSCPLPASSLALPGNVNITVTTPAPGGGTSAALSYTTYLSIANNDIVYNPVDGMLYASVLAEGVGSGGNSVAAIDPTTGNIVRQIWVGSNPNKLALSSDGTQLFVGLDGAGAVAQVNLTTHAVVSQFALGGGPGMYNAPYTAKYLAAVPGSPNSVAVALTGSYDGGGDVAIFDSGVARTKTSTSVSTGPLSFGSSSSTLYVANGGTVYKLAVDSTGITASTTFATINSSVTNSLQYDNGKLYLSTGQVLDASAGTLLGTFYSSATTAATGPIVSDSTLGRAFVGSTDYSGNGQVLAFDESSFNSVGSIQANGVGAQGYPTQFQKIVRWGQNGVALSAAFSAYSSVGQIYIFQTSLVKDLSASPADLSVTLTAPTTAATGSTNSWIAKVTNNGPNASAGTTIAMTLDSSLIINSITPSQGSCGTGVPFSCDLGSLANGASATVTVSAIASISGTLAGAATVSSTSYDPTMTNNQAATNTTVTGSQYSSAPSVSAISPNLVQAGSSDFTLTVTGAGFNSASVVNLGTNALTTTYVSATQLTAAVTAAEIANYGWAPITVSNAAPGGGVSQVQPLTIYAMVNVPASGLIFDPYSQQLYATVPSTATSVTGNSVVAINPFTGTVGTPVNVGSQPTVMAETSDGNYLYIGLSGANSLAQFDLLHQSLKTTIPLTLTQSGSTTSVTPSWLATMPGSDSTIAVNVGSPWNNFGIFDISGSTGTFRPNLSGIYSGVDPVFADSSHLYAYDSQTSGAEFYRYSIDASGLTLIDGTTLDGMGGFSGSFELANGLVYGAAGGIANPSTTPPSQVATLPLFDFYDSGIEGDGAAVTVDPSLRKEFLMLVNTAGTWAYGLARYDLTTYTPEALLGMPASMSNIEAGWSMWRFGQDGLALLSSDENYSTDQQVNSVMLLRGPFVTPQLLTANSAAALTTSSSTSLAHGSGNTILTLTGSNLLPGVAITWNGSYRTTTLINSTQATIAVPASDLSTAGTASIVATNPGASASNALQISIN